VVNRLKASGRKVMLRMALLIGRNPARQGHSNRDRLGDYPVLDGLI
jgi:hypothetical protein